MGSIAGNSFRPAIHCIVRTDSERGLSTHRALFSPLFYFNFLSSGSGGLELALKVKYPEVPGTPFKCWDSPSTNSGRQGRRHAMLYLPLPSCLAKTGGGPA